jgi:hypothetical protein
MSRTLDVLPIDQYDLITDITIIERDGVFDLSDTLVSIGERKLYRLAPDIGSLGDGDSLEQHMRISRLCQAMNDAWQRHVTDHQLDVPKVPDTVDAEGPTMMLVRWLVAQQVGLGLVPTGGRRFRFSHDGVSYRVTPTQTIDGRVMQLRIIPKETPLLTQLQTPHYVSQLLLNPTLLRGGLMLMIAPAAQGKSTMLAAAMKHQTTIYGGVGITLEDPIELPLNGIHGNGIIHQLDIENHYNSESKLKALLQDIRTFFPTMNGGGGRIMFGELKSQLAASAALTLANQGWLVSGTIHGDSATQAIRNLLDMACQENMMRMETARTQLANSLRLILDQRMTMTAVPGWQRGRYTTKALAGHGENSDLAKAIENIDKGSSLKELFDQQNAIIDKHAARLDGTGKPRKQSSFATLWTDLKGDADDVTELAHHLKDQ